MAVSPDLKALVDPRPYDASVFVHRRREETLIEDKIDKIKRLNKIPNSILPIWGAPGMGKTWLLTWVYNTYRYGFLDSAEPSLAPTFTILHAFSDSTENVTLAQLVAQLAEKTLAQLQDASLNGERTFLERATQGDVQAFIVAIRELEHKTVPIIMLDNAEKITNQDWQVLELALIEPLSASGRTLLIIAGRRRIPRWRRFDVRQRTEDYDQTQVQALSVEEMTEQIKRRGYRIPAELLYRYTIGNPLLVDAIGSYFHEILRGKNINEILFKEHQFAISQILTAYEQQLLQNVPQSLLKYLYLVAPLRYYRLEALLLMAGKKDEDVAVGHYISILKELDQTEVVWWSRLQRAYMTDDMVRRVINTRQMLEEGHQYVEQHRRAIEIYKGWVTQYPEAGEDFIIEIWFHLASIYLSDQNEKELSQTVRKYLSQYCIKLPLDHLFVIAQHLGVYEQKSQDVELVELLPKPLLTEIRDKIRNQQEKLANQQTNDSSDVQAEADMVAT